MTEEAKLYPVSMQGSSRKLYIKKIYGFSDTDWAHLKTPGAFEAFSSKAYFDGLFQMAPPVLIEEMNELKAQIYTKGPLEWDGFVSSHPDAVNYHQYSWKTVIEKSFGHSAYYLACTDEAGMIHGVLPLIRMKSQLFGHFLVSLPFLNYGGLLSESEQVDKCLLQAAEVLRRDLHASSVELRHVASPHGELPTKTHKVTMIMDLAPDIDSQWRAFGAKVRNQIRKAEKSGLQVLVGGTELLDGFYDVFCQNMRDLGTPVYGKDFFRNILTIFPETTRVFSVLYGNEVVASAITSWFKNTLEVPWASSKRAYRALCPNNILYWKAISYAIEYGFAKFDFGRSTPNEGTYRFKEQWGAKPTQLHWQYLLGSEGSLPELNRQNPKYQLAIAFWQRLPVGLTRILGPRIARSIP